jgi:hypothetical protein
VEFTKTGCTVPAAAKPFAVSYSVRASSRGTSSSAFQLFAITASGKILADQPNGAGTGKIVEVDRSTIVSRVASIKSSFEFGLRENLGGTYSPSQRELKDLPVEVIDSNAKFCADGSTGSLSLHAPDEVVLKLKSCDLSFIWDGAARASVSISTR